MLRLPGPEMRRGFLREPGLGPELAGQRPLGWRLLGTLPEPLEQLPGQGEELPGQPLPGEPPREPEPPGELPPGEPVLPEQPLLREPVLLGQLPPREPELPGHGKDSPSGRAS